MLKKFLPNQPINILKKLVIKGADNLKKEMMATKLLPTLTTTSLLAELTHVMESKQFHQMNN
jgi:hypothetical protein